MKKETIKETLLKSIFILLNQPTHDKSIKLTKIIEKENNEHLIVDNPGYC